MDMRMRVRRCFPVPVVCVVLLAVGLDSERAESRTVVAGSAGAESDAGIERARQAGIRIDPAVEPLMRAAPVGSCAGDPTAAGCPPAIAVVKSPITRQADGSLGFAPLDGSGDASASTVDGVAAATDQCAVKANPPYKEAGWAKGWGFNTCKFTVTRHELYVNLERYHTNGWRILNSRSAVGGPSQTISRLVTYNCDHDGTYAYRTYSSAYALLRGVWYAATDIAYRNIGSCP